MELGLHGKVALITGASGGIGSAAARALAAEGAHLVLVARDRTRLEAVRSTILADVAVGIEIATCDLARGDEIERLAERYREIDILVNNAGAVPGGNLFEVDDAHWRAGWDSKVFAYVNMCRAFYPAMKARAGGVIVNVLGNGSRLRRVDYICGGMGNAALDFFTETLGAASPQDNIRVVGVSPGPVDTARYRKIAAERVARLGRSRRYPFGRIPTPDEIGAVIAIAASARFGYVSGTVITVDGGLSIAEGAARDGDAGPGREN